MGERLANGNAAIALLANSLATGFALAALILALAPLSGAHFNPLVTLVMAWRREFSWADVLGYVCAQFIGALVGVAAAHAMFGERLFEFSTHVREGPAQWWSEIVATFGLMLVILRCSSGSMPTTAAAVGSYIAAAYWFTASTSFANPSVTLARALTNTFSGIRLSDAPAFIVAQVAGALLAAVTVRWLGGAKRGSDRRSLSELQAWSGDEAERHVGPSRRATSKKMGAADRRPF